MLAPDWSRAGSPASASHDGKGHPGRGVWENPHSWILHTVLHNWAMIHIGSISPLQTDTASTTGLEAGFAHCATTCHCRHTREGVQTQLRGAPYRNLRVVASLCPGAKRV